VKCDDEGDDDDDDDSTADGNLAVQYGHSIMIVKK